MEAVPGPSLSAAASVVGMDPSASSMLAASSSAAAAMATSSPDVLAAAPDDLNGTVLGHVVWTLMRWTPGILIWLVTFVTITVPTLLFTIFSTTLTISLNATTVLLIVLVFASTLSWIVRYRYLNMYAHLPPEPQRKEPDIDMFSDMQNGDRGKPGLANYLDEFLSAIKVFGYLERPVFHELTRTMQTRKLVAGETLLLEEEKGFCLVVDGLVQIFVRTDRDEDASSREDAVEGQISGFDLDTHERQDGDPASEKDSPRPPRRETPRDESRDEKENQQGYQLLTEVRNGASMSSLFSVLSLFAEDVKLRHDDEADRPRPRSAGHPSSDEGHRNVRSPSRDRNIQRDLGFDAALRRLSNVPSLSLDDGSGRHGDLNGARNHNITSQPSQPSRKSAHPNIVARATTDTTIAIIPASAFRRLTRVYPKATAHIVQVILSRLQRVTFATAHSYLGLTEDVALIEKSLNRFTSYDLPNRLRGAPLTRLKGKFEREKDRLGSNKDETKGIALHNPNAGRRRRSSTSMRKDTLARMSFGGRIDGHRAAASVVPPEAMTNVSPGDLLSNFPVSNSTGHHPTASLGRVFTKNFSAFATEGMSPLATFDRPLFAPSPRLVTNRQESMDEDDIWRDAILNCITKAVGLTNIGDSFNKPESVEHSPRLVAYDRARQMATFSNAFGFIDPYDSPVEADTESLQSASVVSTSGVAMSREALNQELRDELEIVYFPKDAILVEQGERNPGLYYVIDGFLDVSFPVEKKSVLPTAESGGSPNNNPFNTPVPSSPSAPFAAFGPKPNSKLNENGLPKTDKPQRKSVYMIKPGDIAGYIGTVSSYRSFVDVRAKTDVYVGFLPRASVERLVEKYPMVLLTMAKRLTTMLPRLILQIDFALEWVHVPAGDILHHQGDESDAIYIVLNGRLRGVQEKGKGEMRVIGEYGQGESVGELEVMTESTRPATLHAIRDAEIARFPKTLFNSLAMEHAGITMKISKIIAQRMRALVEDPMFEKGKDKRTVGVGMSASSSLNLRTIAVLPVTAGVPVVEFGTRLLNALTQIGVPNGVTSLNYAAILNHLGRHAFSKMGKLKLSQYLADLEEIFGMLLYIADTNVNSPWTQTCISQADCILLVGLAEASPAIGEYERFLLGMKTTSRKELVLLHSDRYSPQGLTRKWLSNRLWINGGHHHIQMAFQAQTAAANPQTKRFGAALKQRVQILQAEIQKYTSRRIRQTPIYNSDTPFKGDFHRLARRLCGRSVGLVLGGGGARGIAHIGIIRALEEADVPIDIVGGTSIGAFIGALYAREGDVVPMYGRAKRFAGRMGSMWRFALDLTYPTISYTTGHEFNRGIFKTFGNSQIEDFWLPFYCNTTNITKSRSEIHNSGYVWRYVRASMSLAGLLPPLCDEGSMLLDGGYIDNLTVSHMKSLGADTVFAIDVGSPEDDTPQAYGDSLSGLWAVINRWNPFSNVPNPPTLSEIQARLAYVSSVDAQRRAMKAPGCIYLRPPIDKYSTLEFASFEEIYDVGYKFGTDFLAKLRGKGVLPTMEETDERKKLRRTLAPRRASI